MKKIKNYIILLFVCIFFSGCFPHPDCSAAESHMLPGDKIECYENEKSIIVESNEKYYRIYPNGNRMEVVKYWIKY
jgi:hypothetical protein